MRKAGSSRHLILDAAERVVIEEGARNLTLDAVSARAGVSKGGFLYHFPTKEALLQAMVERRCSSFGAQIGEKTPEDGGPGEALAAYVSVALQRRARDSVAGALIAAIANDPKLLEPMRIHLCRWLPQLDPEAPGFADRAVVWLATEGLWLLELLELSPLNPRQRREIATHLAKTADQWNVSGNASRAPARMRRPAALHTTRRSELSRLKPWRP